MAFKICRYPRILSLKISSLTCVEFLYVFSQCLREDGPEASKLNTLRHMVTADPLTFEKLTADPRLKSVA